MLQLRSLQHLVSVAHRLNFARAAEDMGISQSGLSRSIQTLEKQVGMRFFDRDKVAVSLTPQGRIAVERARILLAEAQDLEHQLTLSASAMSGGVRFGMAPLAARTLLPAVVASRLREAPEVSNEVVVRDAAALWALLVAGDIEFFVINEGFTFEAPQPHVEPLGQFPLSLIVRAGHPLLAGDCPGAKFPIVRASWGGLPLPAHIEGRVLGIPNVIEDFGALAAITTTSDAIWFTSSYAVSDELKAGTLRSLPVPDGSEISDMRIFMYSLPRRSQSPVALSIKRLLRQQIQLLGKANKRAD